MVGTKGFVYIMEVVLISIILIVSLGFLLRPLEVREDWTPIDLRRLGRSALFSIDREAGVENNVFLEEPKLGDELDNLFYSKSNLNVRYSLRVDDKYARRLRIGFNCTGQGCLEGDPEEEYRRLWEVLDESWMNNKSRNVVMEEVNLDLFEGDGYIAEEIDVLFLRGEDQLQEANERKDEIKTFLDNGGSVIQMTDFGEVSDYDIQELFDLENPGSPSGDVQFRNRYDVEKLNYEPSKLFYGVASTVNTGEPGLTEPREGTWRIRDREYTVEVDEDDEHVTVTNETGTVCSLYEGETCDLGIEELDDSTTKLRKISNPDEGAYRNQTIVWFDYPESYEFLGESFTSSAESSDEEREVTEDSSLMVLNEVNGGRTVWISSPEGEEIGSEMQDDVQSLVRSGLLWSGERGEWLEETERSPGTMSSHVTQFGSYKKDIYEPYMITMELWYSY